MKVGDYVAKITNEWQKHNKWMEFPDEKPVPLGIIVGRSSINEWCWDVLTSSGKIEAIAENHIKIICKNTKS